MSDFDTTWWRDQVIQRLKGIETLLFAIVCLLAMIFAQGCETPKSQPTKGEEYGQPE